MSDNDKEGMLESVREHYNAPGADVPRAEMWSAIEAQLSAETTPDGTEVIDLGAERQKRSWLTAHPVGWSVAAAALLVMGVGIGRMTAPAGPAAAVATPAATGTAGLDYAAAEHFGATESLLTMVRADARRGSIDPGTGEWARGLLAQTRMLLDAQKGKESQTGELLEDLELVLIQIVGVAEGKSMDSGRVRTELGLALGGLNDTELLQRLQAASPQLQMSGA